MEPLHQLIGSKLFLFFVDLATFMDAEGRCYPGLRAIAERHSMSLATAHRRIAWLELARLLIVERRGGSATNHYQVVHQQHVRELIEGRDELHPNWPEYWRKRPSAAAELWLDPLGEPTWTPPESETKGNPYSPIPNPASLPTEPRARASKDGSEQPAAAAEPHPDPTSSAPVPQVDKTAPFSGMVAKVEGADGSAAPRLLPSRKAAGPTMRRLIDGWWHEDLASFASNFRPQDLAGIYRSDPETMAKVNRHMRCAGYRAPAHVRRLRKILRKGSGGDKRPFHLLAMGVSNCLPSNISQGTYWNVIVAGKLAGDSQAQTAFDALVRLYRAKQNADRQPGGPQWRPIHGPGNRAGYGIVRVGARKVTERDPCESVAGLPRAKILGENNGSIFHKYPYATGFEAFTKSSESASRSPIEANVRSLTCEHHTGPTNTNANIRYETGEPEPCGAQTRVCGQCATSDPGSAGGPRATQASAWLRSPGGRAELAEDRGLSRRGLVGNDGDAGPEGAGLNSGGSPPPAGGGGGGRTLDRRICENFQVDGSKNKNLDNGLSRRRPRFTQIEGLPPSTYLVPR